ncbi:MAG: hypothetical protein WBP26_00060 [Candidatus Saccharimonadales bacterium]
MSSVTAGFIDVGETIPELREPGTVITLPGTGQLLQLEHIVGATIVQNVTRIGQWSGFAEEFMDSWKARRSLPEILKGKDFHGRLLDIELVAMDDPIGRLVASERADSGLSGMGGSDMFGKPDNAKQTWANMFGYGFHARAQRQSSSRRGPLGPIIADLWYVPKSSTPRVAQLGGIMQRMVRIGSWSDEDFTTHIAQESTPKLNYDDFSSGYVRL